MRWCCLTFLRAFGRWGQSDAEFKGLEGIAVNASGNIGNGDSIDSSWQEVGAAKGKAGNGGNHSIKGDSGNNHDTNKHTEKNNKLVSEYHARK